MLKDIYAITTAPPAVQSSGFSHLVEREVAAPVQENTNGAQSTLPSSLPAVFVSREG